jgi:hypothetical protein
VKLPRFPVYVVSKGRAGKSRTVRHLFGIPFMLVVEPQDEIQYRLAYPFALIYVLPENDLGVAYARQCMLEHVRSLGVEKFWQIDDNIGSFSVCVNGVWRRSTAVEVLTEVEDKADLLGIEMAAPDFRAWKHEHEWTKNSHTVCCVLTPTVSVDYDVSIVCHEDIDFCVRHLLAGGSTIRFHRLAIKKAHKMGTMIGGCQGKALTPRVLAERQGEYQMRMKYPHLLQASKGYRGHVKWRLLGSYSGDGCCSETP